MDPGFYDAVLGLVCLLLVHGVVVFDPCYCSWVLFCFSPLAWGYGELLVWLGVTGRGSGHRREGRNLFACFEESNFLGTLFLRVFNGVFATDKVG